MEFLIGCNYWASNAGTEMWLEWDENVIRKDFELLAENGINTLRVFPNWRDFQPVYPLFDMTGIVREYRLYEKYLPENPYYLDELMLKRFEKLCDIAAEYNLKLIVGILTGWMSGRMFIPPALYGKNLFTDFTALSFEQKFVEGFVRRIKNKSAVYAWNLGNECNCMANAPDHDTAEAWTMLITNAIRANDSEHPVISGMHGLSNDGVWRITEQAAHTDMLTTHPYPYFVPHCAKDKISAMRTLLHATCETKYYSDIGNKPCLVEELGTLGPSICDNETAAGFLKVNLFSNFANGASGVLWWCANEQIMLKAPPYCWNMCETELGLSDKNMQPKPVLYEMKKFSEFLKNTQLELPKAKEDGVVILTEAQDNWGIAYMSYMLAKQAKVNLRFIECKQELPQSKVYLVPSVRSVRSMPSYKLNELKEKVYSGADLYISNDEALISEFSDLTGLVIRDSETANDSGEFCLNGKKIPYQRNRRNVVLAKNAEVIAEDRDNMPVFSVYKYGKGRVYYLNFPLEKMLLNMENAYETDAYEVYRLIFKEQIEKIILTSDSRYIGITEHFSDKARYVVAINYSDKTIEKALSLKEGYKIKKVIYGDFEKIEPFETAIFEIE